jgi:Protein of unknown function (DUF2892)
MFNVNVGTVDRVLRVVIGASLTYAAATGLLGAWAWIGVVPVMTGLFARCPAYSLLGIKTCKAP